MSFSLVYLFVIFLLFFVVYFVVEAVDEVLINLLLDVAHLKLLASILAKDERVENLTIFYGSGSPRFHATFIPNLGGTHFAQYIVNTHNDEETQGMLDDYAEKYANYFSDARILFRQIEYSDKPYPIEVQVAGDNLDSVHVAIDSIRNRLSHNPKIAVLSTSFGATNNCIEVNMNPEEAYHFGLSKSLLSLNFAMRYGGGIPVTSIWEGDKEVGVVIKDAKIESETIDDFKNIRNWKFGKYFMAETVFCGNKKTIFPIVSFNVRKGRASTLLGAGYKDSLPSQSPNYDFASIEKDSTYYIAQRFIPLEDAMRQLREEVACR